MNKPDGWYARTALIALSAVIGFGAGVGLFLVQHYHSSISEPTPISTLRAPNCFDGTLEPGCPDFSNSYEPKPIKQVVKTKDGYRIEYEGGTTDTIIIEGR